MTPPESPLYAVVAPPQSRLRRPSLRAVDGSSISAFLGPLTGAMAALLGVLITQRGERKKAHAALVWAQRSEAYAALFLMCERDIGILSRGRGGWSTEERAVLDTPLTDSMQVNLYLFGRDRVVKTYKTYRESLTRLLLADPIHGLELSGEPEDKRRDSTKLIEFGPHLEAVASECIKLRELVRKEARGDG